MGSNFFRIVIYYFSKFCYCYLEMNRNNRQSLNDALNHILNDESDFEKLDDKTDSDLEA